MADTPPPSGSSSSNSSTWSDLVFRLVEFAAKNPQEFLVSFFICLTPLMFISGYLAYLMIKQIEDEEKSKKKKATKSMNQVRSRKKAVKAD